MADTIAENLEKLKTLLESYDAISTDVALIDQKTGDIATLIGEPAEGQESTLFAAIAAGGGGGSSTHTTDEVYDIVNTFGERLSTILGDGLPEDTSVWSTTPTSFTDAIFNGYKWLVNLESTIQVIGADYVFYGCTSLKSISLPALTTIKNQYLFASCTSLQVINLPALITISGQNLFNGCSSLQSLRLPALTTIGQGGSNVFFRCTSLNSVDLPALTTIGDQSTFYGCTSIKSISLPELTYINGSNLFNGCTALQSVSLPKLAYFNGNSQFSGCTNLISIIIGSAMTASFSLNTWSPTNALSSTSTSLVDEGESFASNLEKLLYNIREHIAANLPDRSSTTALTLTLSSAMKSAINADAETLAAFTDKNWTIA